MHMVPHVLCRCSPRSRATARDPCVPRPRCSGCWRFRSGFLFLFGCVMARGDARVAAYMMPGLLTTTLMSGTLFGVALPLVSNARTDCCAGCG